MSLTRAPVHEWGHLSVRKRSEINKVARELKHMMPSTRASTHEWGFLGLTRQVFLCRTFLSITGPLRCENPWTCVIYTVIIWS